MSMYQKSVILSLLLFLLLPVTAFGQVQVVGEIVLIEDTEGTILSFPAVSMPNVYLQNVSCAFYNAGFEDKYDALFIFNNSATVVQQGWSAQNFNEGIGRPLYDWTANHCANKKRLRITVSMGNVTTLPLNPDDLAPIVPFYPLTGNELMAHEFGHHWLASVTYDKNDGKGKQCLLRGYEPSGGQSGIPTGDGDCSRLDGNDFNQHWSYYYDSCSLMYGSCIDDLGGGNFRFSYPLNKVKFSHLDQYLMGLRAPEEVEPMFLVTKYDTSGVPEVVGSASIPMGHNTTRDHSGFTRVDVTIDDIIRSIGPRNPPTDSCHWKAAFILVHPPDQPPLPIQVQQMEAYRERWESFYAWATDYRGSFDTTLAGCGAGTEGCPYDVPAGCGEGEDGDSLNCLDGQTRCDTDQVTVLSCINDQWVPLETCEGICVLGQCEEAPTDGDQPDGDTPDGDKPDGDKNDGDAPDGDLPGDGDEPGSDGDISGCDPGLGECLGGAYRRCSFTGNNWEKIEDCAARGLDCDPANGCVEKGLGATGGCQTVNRRELVFIPLVVVLGYLVWRRLRRRNT